MVSTITDAESLLNGSDGAYSMTEELMKMTLLPLEKRFEDLKKNLENDKAHLQNELRDMKRQMYDTARQINKLCLIFSGAEVEKILNRKNPNIFIPVIELLERYYDIYIPDWEIMDIHPLTKYQNGKKIPSVICKWNSRHDKSSYWYVIV